MPELNQYKIYRGTLEKRFNVERGQLMKDYDKTSAEDFFFVYKDAPLSFILAHSKDIFPESYCGYPFYLKILQEVLLDPITYEHELVKVDGFIAVARKRGYSKAQIGLYETLREILTESVNAHATINEIVELVRHSDNGPEFLTVVFDALYDVYLEEKKFCDDDDCMKHVTTHLDYVAEAIFTSPSPYVAVAIGFLFIGKYPQYSDLMVNLIHNFKDPEALAENYGCARRGLNALKKLSRSSMIEEIIKKSENACLMKLWCEIQQNSVDDLLPVPVNITNLEGLDAALDGSVVGDLAVMLESAEDSPQAVVARYDNYRYKAAQIDADLDFLNNYEALTNASDITYYESASLLQDSYEGEALMLEWEADGSPNKVVLQHILTSKERAELEEAKKREKISPIGNLSGKNEKAEMSAKNEQELCGKIKKTLEQVKKLEPTDNKDELVKNNEELKSARAELVKYKELLKENDYREATKLCDELKDEILSADKVVTEEFSDPELDAKISMFLEESDKLSKDTPRKPKEDLPTKIQNKALDHAAKDSEKLAKKTADRQKLKNAANAVAQKPKRITDDLKSFVKKFESWDENRRKAFLLKPGYRHKIFKHFKNALMFGAIAKVKLAYIPFLGLLKHCSNLKDKRIRNELAKELDSEIRICEEKITDANSAGDNKTKYELMRIKDKLEAEKTRVRLNSNYI